VKNNLVPQIVMSLTTRNILFNILYYGLLYVLTPWFLLTIERYWYDIPGLSMPVRIFSVTLGISGTLIQLWAIILFQKIGKGTPIPALAPKHFVQEGPYKWVRNPINIGELLLLFSIALWFQSLFLLVYVLSGAVAFHLFIVYYEEPKHRRIFGEEYEKYLKQVNRWIPKKPGNETKP
jgi:protein-S-isoprenylcysteine O-methyltransferase Ste14